MLFFRSEEHVDRWRQTWSRPPGASITAQTCAALSVDWYGTKLRMDWRRRPIDEAQAIFLKHRMDSDFWSLR